MVSSRSSTIRFVSVAKFPLIIASWSNSALVLMESEKDREKRKEAKDTNIKKGR